MYSVNPITYHVMSCHTRIILPPYLTCRSLSNTPYYLTTLTSAMHLHGFLSVLFFFISRSFYFDIIYLLCYLIHLMLT
jgi:hypothetical protein